MAFPPIDSTAYSGAAHDESYFETLHASAGPDTWSPAMFNPTTTTTTASTTTTTPTTTMTMTTSGELINVAAHIDTLTSPWIVPTTMGAVDGQFSWNTSQFRSDLLRTPYSDPGVSTGLHIFTGAEPLSVDDVPALSGATEESITTTGISPEEFRSPLQPRNDPTNIYAASTSPQFGRGHSVPPTSATTPRPDDVNSGLTRQVGRNFPASTVAPLRDWFRLNMRDPYPSKEMKQHLADASGLTVLQVNNWFINQRKRTLPKDLRTVLDGNYTTSPELFTNTIPTADVMDQFPVNVFGTDLLPFESDLNAMPTAQHWPVPEAQQMPMFHSVMQATPRSQSYPLPHPSSAGGSVATLSPTDYRVPVSISARTSPVTTFIPRTRSAGNLASSSAQEAAFGPRRGRRRQFLPPRVDPLRAPSKDEVPSKREKAHPHSSQDESGSDSSSERDAASDKKAGEIFQCTFPGCGKSFSSKTWKRHEETKHLPRFQWTCMASGFLCHDEHSSSTGDHSLPTPHMTPNFSANFLQPAIAPGRPPTCIFCKLEVTNVKAHPNECIYRLHDCLSRPSAERTFTRKDHLFQHLRNFHRFTPPDGSFGAEWKSRVEYAGRSWGCGFCGERLGSWERRARHLRSHFREGWRMETGWDESKARGNGWGPGRG